MKRRSKDSERPVPGKSKITRANFVVRIFREYRFLAVILGLALPLGVFEALSDHLPKSSSEVPAAWLMDERRDLARTLVDLYPQRSQGYLFRSYQAGMCWDRGFQPEVCRTFKYQDLRDVLDALQLALARGGSADQEELFHFYAFMLVRFQQPPEVIDAAIKNWRRNYPYSFKPDPRELPQINIADSS